MKNIGQKKKKNILFLLKELNNLYIFFSTSTSIDYGNFMLIYFPYLMFLRWLDIKFMIHLNAVKIRF